MNSFNIRNGFLVASLSLSLLLPLAPLAAHAQEGTPQDGVAAAVNLLTNASFEQGGSSPDGWTAGAWTSGAVFARDTGQAHEGRSSAKIVASQPNDAAWRQVVAVQPDSAYRLSGWIKTEQIVPIEQSTYAGANLSIEGAWTSSLAVRGTADWTYVTATFTTDAATPTVTVMARVGFYGGTCTGTAWFDDLRLELIHTPTASIQNPGFEQGAGSEPEHWWTERYGGSDAVFSWDTSQWYGGSRSVKITTASGSEGRWMQSVLLEPDTQYELGGWVKTENVRPTNWWDGAALGVYGQGNWMSARSSSLAGNNGWRRIAARFITGGTHRANIGCVMVNVSGTMWCDDLVLTKIGTLPRMAQSGQHLALDVYADHWTGVDVSTYLKHLDETYDAMVDLMGFAPLDGAVITAREDYSMAYGMFAGNPIVVNPDIGWGDAVRRNGMEFGMPHEIGHDFDIWQGRDFYMGSLPFNNGEQWANFKLVYAFDVLGARHPELKVEQWGMTMPLSQMGQQFVEQQAKPWLAKKQPNYLEMPGDTYTGLLYSLVQRVGWEPFRAVFREYGHLPNPPTTAEGQVELLANMLSWYAGTDLIPDFRAWGFPVQRYATNLVKNEGFAQDSNGDNRPDSWTSSSRFTRSTALAHTGTYSGRHSSTSNASYTISQTVAGLSAGTTYSFLGWVNIPPTSDSFSFRFEVKWLNASGGTVRTDLVKSFSRATDGWWPTTRGLVAPKGTTSAQVRMVVGSLNAKVYVDDVSLVAANVARNASFESDTNGDGVIDDWTGNSYVSRSSTVAHRGKYSLRHQASDNASYGIWQTVPIHGAQTVYHISGWVDIPPANDANGFSLTISANWRDANNTVIQLNDVASFNAQTAGWAPFAIRIQAPVGARSLTLRQGIQDLSATVYVDDLTVQPVSIPAGVPLAAPFAATAELPDTLVTGEP